MTTPVLAGVHHVKIPVTDLGKSLEWYRRVFGVRPTIEFRDADGVTRGVVADVPGLGATTVGFRVNAAAAEGCRGFDPVSFAVAGRVEMEAWIAHLDALRGGPLAADRGLDRLAAGVRGPGRHLAAPVQLGRARLGPLRPPRLRPGHR